MGFVYKARQISLNRLVAVKMIRPDAPEGRTLADRFLREAEVMAKMAHPNIVKVHAVGDFDVVHHAAANEADLTPRRRRNIQNLLDARDGRGEAGDDYLARRGAH